MDIKPGQIWKDDDPRSNKRRVVVRRVFEKKGKVYAAVENYSSFGGGRRNIRADRMGIGPKGGKLGWSLVSEGVRGENKDPMVVKDGRLYCIECGTGTDDPERQGLLFCHTQDCDWLIANVEPTDGWRLTPGATKSPVERAEAEAEWFGRPPQTIAVPPDLVKAALAVLVDHACSISVQEGEMIEEELEESQALNDALRDALAKANLLPDNVRAKLNDVRPAALCETSWQRIKKG